VLVEGEFLLPVPVADPIVIAPSPTPFTADDRVDIAAVERNTERWLKTPLSGFMLNSENGEEAFLSEQERLDIIRAVNRARNGQKFIVGGIDNPSVTESLRTAETLAEAGAELVRVRIPRLTDNVRGYFDEMIPRLPVPAVLINQPAPGMFGQSLPLAAGSPEMIGAVCEMDNVYGYIAGGNIRFESMTRMHVPADKKFWIGNGVLLLPGAAIGANGACLMFGNIAAAETIEMLTLVMNGELAKAQEMQKRLNNADWLVLSRGAAGIKAAMNLLGYEGTQPRRPSTALSDAENSRLKAAMTEAGLL
jgi:dihydrodipicolinate synthase/N-acetylneuraminate lyase